MKRHYYKLAVAAICSALLFSCQWEEYDETKGQTEDNSAATIEIIASEDLAFPPAGGEGTITLSSGSGVTVSSNKDWCHAALSGNVIAVSADKNTSKQSRYARVTVKAGDQSTYVTVQQFGEVFSGLEMTDFLAPCEGSSVTLAFHSNMDVKLSSDQNWVTFNKDDIEETVEILVAANTDPSVRFANIGFTSGTVSGSAVVTQAPPVAKTELWTFALTDGMFDFPDQVDQITATPGDGVVKYAFTVVGKDEVEGDIDGWIEDSFMASLVDDLLVKDAESLISSEITQEFRNLASTVYAVAVGFDADGYLTGQYAYSEIAIPDRGPVKALVEGWDVSVASEFDLPVQKNTFTITPKSGYESVKYIATAVEKSKVSDVEDYAFTTFAMSTREDLLAKVEAGEIANFDAGLSTGASDVVLNLPGGDYYVVVVAFSDNKFYTGDYSVVELSIDDELRKNWLGDWTLTNDAGDSYKMTFAEKDTPIVDTLSMYCNGLYTGTGSLLKSMTWMDVVYNDDGTLSLYGQKHPEKQAKYSSTYGEVYPCLFGFYVNTSDSKTYYTTSEWYYLLTLEFESANKVVIKEIAKSGDYEYKQMAVRLWRVDTSSYMYFTSQKTITFAGLTLTK